LKEEETLLKIEENRIKYNLMLKNMKESDCIQREELKKKIADNESYAESFKDKMEKIIELGRGYELEKEKKKKQKKKKEEEEFIKEEFEENEDSDEKPRKNKKRQREGEIDNDNEQDYDENGAKHDGEKKVKKLRKKRRLEEEEEGEKDNDFEMKEEFTHNQTLEGCEENYYHNSSYVNNDIQKEELRDLEMKNYSKNEPDEEVDFNE
jgi:hypothetical protein